MQIVAIDAMPPDPFAGDPFDPARAFDKLDGGLEGPPPEPLDDAERADVQADLTDLALYQQLLEPRGIRGIVVDCGDCAQPHYHDWDLLQASLRQLLADGVVRPHEPACDPVPAEYVSWDYCRGFADGALAVEVPGE